MGFPSIGSIFAWTSKLLRCVLTGRLSLAFSLCVTLVLSSSFIFGVRILINVSMYSFLYYVYIYIYIKIKCRWVGCCSTSGSGGCGKRPFYSILFFGNGFLYLLHLPREVLFFQKLGLITYIGPMLCAAIALLFDNNDVDVGADRIVTANWHVQLSVTN